ncbi:MAG: efflux transporter periplasmic adaptor subunit [Micavibrio aeruginosavorus]|uniref:Efflux transporter periplasmic adaptor subunit n=1 Tax=Micavibrio aeruginosavorus TaxID=349221 RepID=A0A2W5FMV8_9BACT|nr:MAG: efflux transporter periplasmic adaptor subunit [Micavibrio aeruginosavorus]PZP56363.1 MAG: efflux transporter periplasmic adaptor subunit [Micavibrio aeruginosavorus]
MKKNYKLILLALAILSIAAGGYYYSIARTNDLEGVAYGNGRIEAQSIDIATRHGGRVLSVPVEEGQMVEAGDVVAELDLNDLAASLAGAKANVRATIQQKDAAASSVAQAESALTLASKEFSRADELAREKAVSESRRDQAFNAKQSAEAQLAAAKQNLASATEAIDVAQSEVSRIEDLLKDQHLTASKAGRVLYKLVEPGEVMSAGGKAVTLLDLTDVYMTIFLTTETVGKLRLGEESRIVLDAMPDLAIPAYISYISPEAQFTPRQVETRTEREKLTFRVKVKIPPELLAKYIDQVKTGLPGMAYIKTDKKQDWPDRLKGDAALMKDVKSK